MWTGLRILRDSRSETVLNQPLYGCFKLSSIATTCESRIIGRLSSFTPLTFVTIFLAIPVYPISLHCLHPKRKKMPKSYVWPSARKILDSIGVQSPPWMISYFALNLPLFASKGPSVWASFRRKSWRPLLKTLHGPREASPLVSNLTVLYSLLRV